MSADENYVKEMVKNARASYAEHQILERGPGYWVCGRPGSNQFKFEARSLLFGALYVGGDIDHMIFAQYTDSPDPERKLRWIGEHADVSYYVAQKAMIGMGDGDGRSVWTYEPRATIEAYQQTLKDPELTNAQRDALNAAIEATAAYEAREEVIRALYESDAFHPHDIDTQAGKVPSPRLIYAWQAVKKVVELLDAARKVGENGAP